MITKDVVMFGANFTPMLNLIFAFIALIIRNTAPEVSDVIIGITDEDEEVTE